jgi:hypothetical protein
MSLQDQITLALEMQLTEGDWNLSEPVTYEPENHGVVTGLRAVVNRDSSEAVDVFDGQYVELTATILVPTALLPRAAMRGDLIRTELGEVWRVRSVMGTLPGAARLRVARKVPRDAVTA